MSVTFLITDTQFTRGKLEVVGVPTPPDVSLTRAVLQVAATAPANPAIRLGRESMQVMGQVPAPIVHLGRAVMQVLCTHTPNYARIPVIVSDVFPYDISYDSVGSTRFATDVLVVDSGDDQRTQRWDQPVMEYDVAYGVRTMEQLIALVAFFRSMRGRAIAFNYQDNVDYTSSIPTRFESRAAPPITPFDQGFAVGDSNTMTFQLYKTYATATQTQPRPITRPIPGTTRIGVNGVEVTNWTVDTNTGLVTFSSAFFKLFTDALTTSVLTGNTGRLSGVANDFNGFKPFVGYRVTTSGFVNAQNNVPLTQVATIGAVAANGSTMDINFPASFGGVVEITANATVSLHPAPQSGSSLTAGFWFYVPVRFDTDTLPLTIADYGVGGANSVKLIEVRPNAF